MGNSDSVQCRHSQAKAPVAFLFAVLDPASDMRTSPGQPAGGGETHGTEPSNPSQTHPSLASPQLPC